MKETHLLLGDYWPVLSQGQRDACYNGMGAAWMPDFSRKVLDWLFDVLEEAVRIHDVDFTYAITEEEFHQANKRLKKNSRHLVKVKIPWWRWHKRRRFRKYWIPIIYAAVESKGGWKAFVEAEKLTV